MQLTRRPFQRIGSIRLADQTQYTIGRVTPVAKLCQILFFDDDILVNHLRELPDASRGFGGPDQVDNTIANDDETVSGIIEGNIYEPWFEWKKGLQEKHGLSFSIDYSLAWLGASDSPEGAEDQASSGMVRFFGSWELVGRESGNTGAFVWKVEHRHKYATIPANAFGFNLGYAGLIVPPFIPLACHHKKT